MKSKSYKIKPLTLSIATAVAVGVGANAGYAQRQIEEVVVTAERREATEQTTSISMEVFNQDMLSAGGISQLQDLQNAMPGIQVTNNGVGNDINIRGIGNNTFAPFVQMGVQVVNDGVTHGEPMGLNGGFFDVGTIEVLRGPQGTFVGQSAAGGAILINSANPNFDGINGYVEGRMGNYQHNAVTGALNLPISDTWAARIAWNTEERNSFYKNLGGSVFANGQHLEAPGGLDNRQIRASLLWQPNDQFEALFKVEQNRVDNYGDVRQPNQRPLNVNIPDPVTNLPVTITTRARHADYSPVEPFEIINLFPSKNWQQNQQWSAWFTYEFDNGMTLISKNGYNKLHTEMDSWNSDDDYPGNSAVPIWPTSFSLDESNRSWTHEITLASADDGGNNWIVGVFDFHRTTPVNLAIPGGQGNLTCGNQPDGTVTACAPLVTPSSFTHVAAPTTVEHQAIFGQYNYQINDELELAIGARYNVDDSHEQPEVYLSGASGVTIPPGTFDPAVCQQIGVFPQNFGTPDLTGTAPSMGCIAIPRPINSLEADGVVDNEVPTYKIGLNWSPTDTDYFYAFYARGYKAGSFAGAGVQPETIDDYELGWKGSLFDGVLTGDIGFYYMDYSDIQGETFVFNDPQGIGSSYTNSNIADAEMYGVEASAQMFFGDLGIDFSFAWQDSEIGTATDVPLASLPAHALTPNSTNGFNYLPDCSVVTGGAPNPATAADANGDPNGNCFDYSPFVQNYQGQQMIQAPELSYNIGIDYVFPFGNGTLTPRLEFSHTDENYANLDQQFFYLNDERDLTNFSLTFENENWNVQAYVFNLTDEVYVNSARLQQVLYGNPMTYGLRAKYNF
jgi:iron complex outermembrane receptor protein